MWLDKNDLCSEIRMKRCAKKRMKGCGEMRMLYMVR